MWGGATRVEILTALSGFALQPPNPTPFAIPILIFMNSVQNLVTFILSNIFFSFSLYVFPRLFHFIMAYLGKLIVLLSPL